MEDNIFPTHYPDYNVLDKWSSPDWDDQTREVVRRRLEEIPRIRFFTDDEACTLAAIAERIVPQPDRREAEKVPIVPWIDEKLHEDKRDGYRYEELPPQREAWRLGLKGVDETAQALFNGKLFLNLDPLSQDVVLTQVARGDSPGGTWKRLSAIRFFKDVLCSTVVRIYYAHPLAWNEMGCNGPSSPRGHVRVWEGFYPWGKRRRRYPQREHELNASAEVLVRGCTNLGIPVAPAPIATLSAPHKDRPPCVYHTFDCGRPTLRHPRETKGDDYELTQIPDADCCRPEGACC